jgi:hypothetical protein
MEYLEVCAASLSYITLHSPVIHSKKGSTVAFQTHSGNVKNKQANKLIVGFKVLTVASTKMAVLQVIELYSLVEVYRHFTGACCLHHQDHDGEASTSEMSKMFYQTTQCYSHQKNLHATEFISSM